MKTQHKHKVLASQFPEDARVHYTVLKQQPTHQQQTTTNDHPSPAPGKNRNNNKLVTPKPNSILRYATTTRR